MPFDVALDDDDDLPIRTRHISGTDLVLQRVRIRLRTFLGEWILDQFQGLDYLGFTQQKPPNVVEITNLVRREIETTPGVDRVENFDGQFVNTTTVNPTIRITGDVILTGEESVAILAAIGLTAGNSTPAVISFQRSGAIAAA